MKRLISALWLLLALSACSSMSKQTDAEKLALYRSYAGAPVGDFQYFGRLNGWSPLGDSRPGGLDQAQPGLLVGPVRPRAPTWTTPRRSA